MRLRLRNGFPDGQAHMAPQPRSCVLRAQLPALPGWGEGEGGGERGQGQPQPSLIRSQRGRDMGAMLAD